MTNEALFALASAFALPGWVSLALAPVRRARAVLIARIFAATLCGLYATMLVTGLAGEGPPPGAGFSTLAGVRLLLSSEAALLAGWVHYLAFDLWAGAWETEQARLPHWQLLPCLALTFLAGPTGLLLFLILAAIRRT